MEIASGEGIFDLRNASVTEEITPDKDMNFIVSEENTEIILNDAAFAGIEVSITVLANASITYDGTDGESHTDALTADSKVVYIYTGSAWFLSSSAAPGPEPEPSVPSGYTYVVDSSEALMDWLTNAEGNDYTYVYIAPGRHVIDYTQLPNLVPLQDGRDPETFEDLPARTLAIEGAPGAVICDDGQTDILPNGEIRITLLSYSNGSYNMINKDYSIKNVTFDIAHYGVRTLLYGFHRVVNCDFNLVNNTVVPDSVYEDYEGTVICGAAADCFNIINCTCTFGFSETAQAKTYYGSSAFSGCFTISNFYGQFETYSEDDTITYYDMICMFDHCTALTDCVVFGGSVTVQREDDYSIGINAFHHCYMMSHCVSNGTCTDTDGNTLAKVTECKDLVSCYADRFDYCTKVIMCCKVDTAAVPSFTPRLGAYFNECYVDDANTIPVGNDSVGGFNKTSTRPGGDRGGF